MTDADTQIRPLTTDGPPRLGPAERAEVGRTARKTTPRSDHADWEMPSDRPDPVALLEEQATTRVPELVPIRYGRMAPTPFTYFRGAAYMMAYDLAHSPSSGMRAQLCGDAHLSNFGLFASPERNVVFDLNDFDETIPGPWEWDVKRLAASVAISGRDRGFSPKQRAEAVGATVAHYRIAMAELAELGEMEVWYRHISDVAVRERFGPEARATDAQAFNKLIAKARNKDSARAFTKLASTQDGTPRIIADEPLIVPLEQLLSGAEAVDLHERLGELVNRYRSTLAPHRRYLLDRYVVSDMARKVVGVGSVGTRAWVILMIGRDAGDPLFLQAKEAQESVLAPFVGASEFANQGERVVEGQRLMQTVSDTLLGWLESTGIDGVERDFYLRQLWDWKGSADVDAMTPVTLRTYGQLCGWTLARAHARSGDAIAISAYLGRGDVFDRALVAFAEAYADQNERDHRALLEAIDGGRVEAITGV